MKPILSLVAACALLSPITSGHSQDITVRGDTMTRARWANVVSQKLDDALIYPHFFSNEIPSSGIVSVRFTLDDGNRPSAVTLSRRSGDRRLDRAAMAALEKMGAFPSTPSAILPGQTFVANILFATTFDEYDREVARLRDETKAHKAKPNIGEAVAFVITSHAGAGS